MDKLSMNWIGEGIIDLEYKQYILLGYLKTIEERVEELKLFPYFTDLLDHYENLNDYRLNKTKLSDQFPKELSKINLKEERLEYKDVYEDNKELKIIDDIVDFAQAEIGKAILMVKDKVDEVTKCVDVVEIGTIQSMNIDEGYIIINTDDEHLVYRYMFGLLDARSNNTLQTKLYRRYPRNMDISYKSIKLDLYATGDMGNPSVFLVDNAFKYPIKETLLPIAKRILIKKLVALRTIH